MGFGQKFNHFRRSYVWILFYCFDKFFLIGQFSNDAFIVCAIVCATAFSLRIDVLVQLVIERYRYSQKIVKKSENFFSIFVNDDGNDGLFQCVQWLYASFQCDVFGDN